MQFQRIITNFTPSLVRHEKMEDRDYLVVPMVMLVEGVHEGSEGPLYYPVDELSKIPFAWNHKPVVVYHPAKGQSACTPEELTVRKIGVILNTKWDGKLRAEAWLEQSRIDKVDPRIATAIENSEPMELSTGLYGMKDDIQGVWNNESYSGILRNYVPDHLAVLPDLKGACSIADGAGFIMNAEKKTFEISLEDKQLEIVKTFNAEKRLANLLINEISFDDTRMLLSSKLRDQPENTDTWIEAVYDNYFIYEKEGKFFKQDYTEEDSVVNFVGLPQAVIKSVSYQTLTNAGENTRKENLTMSKETIVNDLITNGQFEEADRETLMATDERILNQLKPVANQTVETTAEETKTTEVAVDNAAPAAEKKPQTIEEYIADAPAEYRPVLKLSFNTYKAEKKKLVKQIVANKQNRFTEQQLMVKDIEELQNIAVIAVGEVKQTPRYDGQGDTVEVDNEQPALEMPKMSFDKN